MKRKHFKQLTALILSACLTVSGWSVCRVHAATSISVNQTDGTVASTGYDGPKVKKIRILKEANYLEIYWDRYVDETEAIDIDNFVLKNGNTTLSLEAKGDSWTNTLYFDKDNKEIAATSANSMARLDPDLHMSSICFSGTIDPNQEITLEIIGNSIKDEDGKSAQSILYTNIPYISYYTQSVTSETGIVVKADDTVKPESLTAAAKQIDVMLSKSDTGIAENMKKYGCSLAVYSSRENVYLIPEHRYGFNSEMYDVEGYGGNTYNNCVSSIAEQNIIRTRTSTNWYDNTMYRDENILIHEFGHCVRSVGMDLLDDTTLRDEFIAVYDHAVRNHLWPNTYAISNSDEFFATMCAIWFNVMSEASDWNDGTRCPVNTRIELAQYDPVTYEFFSQIFPDATLPSPWDTDVPDNYKDVSYDSNWIPDTEPTEDKKALKKALYKLELIDISLYTESAESILDAARNEALSVYEDTEASALEIDLTVAKLERITRTLPITDRNLALLAEIQTSYVSSWENLDAVNDGQIPNNSYKPSISRYGTWGNNSAYETITYEWDTEITLDGCGIYFWYDGSTYTNGGINAPADYYYEYLDKLGNWNRVSNPSTYHITMDTMNQTSFDPITTHAIRVTLKKQASDSNGVGVVEWQAYGTFSPADKSALENALKEAKTLNKEDYTEDSYQLYAPIIQLAESMYQEELLSEKEIDLIVAALVSGKDTLESAKSDTPQPTPSPTPEPELPYVDVEADDWFYLAVHYQYVNKIMTGINPSHFAPYELLSRAQFALILYRIEGEPDANMSSTFLDVTGDEWYGPAVLWALENQIVSGYENQCFGPADLITREQMAVMMYRYAKHLNLDLDTAASLDIYEDASAVSPFALDSMKWSVSNEIITGKNNGSKLDPLGNTTRAEAAVMIYRFLYNL